jgi:hypothetical protein
VRSKDAYVLTLICPHCGEPFPSAMQIDPPTFAAIRLSNMFERCPSCTHASRFGKDDYLFVDA